MSDSWILIALTILIVFLLFYMSKRLICSGPILTNSNEELGENERIDWSSASHHYCDGEMVGTGHSNYSNHPIMTICHPTNNNNNNNNNFEEKTLDMGNSQMENRLRLQLLITHMILAEKEHKKLELEVTRLARLLAADQGGNSPEECVRNLRNELHPLTSFGNFQSQRLTPHQQRLMSTFPSTFSFISELTSPTKPSNFNIIDELANNNHCSCRCGGRGRDSTNSNQSESSPQRNQHDAQNKSLEEQQEHHTHDQNYIMTSEHDNTVLHANDNLSSDCLNSDTNIVTNQMEKSENKNNNHNINYKSSRTNNTNVTNNITDNSIGYENRITAPSTPQNSGNRKLEHDVDDSSHQNF